MAALACPRQSSATPQDTIDHVDLLIVRRGEMVTVEVPVQFVGDAAAGTLVVYEHNTLTIVADATRLPDHLDASIAGLDAGAQVTAADVTLPEGVTLGGDPEQVLAVVSVATSTAPVTEAEAAEAAEASA